MSDVPSAYAFVLDGQGIPASTAPQTLHTAHQDARTPLGATVLLSCYHAFVRDFNSLTPDERAAAGLTLADCPTPDALLDLPQLAPYNALVANTHLYLLQLLRYVAHLDAAPRTAGVLGFSTGMLAAAVIACADGIPQLVAHATEAFRLAFWMGLRAQMYAQHALADVQMPEREKQPWTLVTFGASRAEVQDAVDRFNVEKDISVQVRLTAMTNDKCASVSARPDVLTAFRNGFLPASTIQSRLASIYTLYHTPSLALVKSQVMHDLATHAVHFPPYTALRHTLRSPVTGAPLTPTAGSSLADDIVSATLLHTANFDAVLAALAFPPGAALVNLGPGNVLWRSTARALPAVPLAMLDWSAAAAEATQFPRVQHALRDSAPQREPIAVVGMAVTFPGAPDVEGLWRVLEQGLNTVSTIPESRFNVAEYTSGAHGAGRTLKTTLGNFVADPAAFDHAFFRVSPREARSMDPQQRLLLHVAAHALESAGYVPHGAPAFDPDTFGTYVGAATNDYVQNLRHDVDVYYSTGTLQAFLSGKLAYAFKLSGPSLVLDTACSSSTVALHAACRALAAGDVNAALAGGVNLITSPDMYLGLDRAHFLSSTGNCRPWDARADGYCRAEGCGLFVLKRLSDAISENDRILGVIKAVEVNQSAQAESITQPHAPTQVDLFRKLLASASLSPNDITVVEAHGTGTQAGDPTELHALRTVLTAPFHLGSIKAHIGHAEAASGAAGLAKLLLMLRHRTLPASPRIVPNPRVALDGLVLAAEKVEWKGGRRRALLNNFGAAGSNAALILEEHEEVRERARAHAFVVGVSCDSEEALEVQRCKYMRQLEEERDAADFAYTATARRRVFGFRLAASGSTREELLAALKEARVVRVEGGKTVWVFSGQGGQYSGMGRVLYATLPAFRETVEACEERLVRWGFPGVVGVIAGGEEEGGVGAFQAAVFVLECALANVWMGWGVKPDAVAGHSLGEYAALVTAGVISLEDGLRIVAGRARLMEEKCVPDETGMLAVKMAPEELERHLISNADYDELSVACHNSCDDGVVGGPLAQLDKLHAELKASGHKCAKVNVPYAYHTRAMHPLLAPLTALASQIPLHPPTLPVLSNVHGTVIAPGDTTIFTPAYFAQHCAEPVRFAQGVRALGDDVATWLELGPHPTCLPMLRATAQRALLLPSLKKGADDWAVIAGSLAALYCCENAVDWRRVFGDLAPGARVTDLPAYPFAKTRFWVKYEEDAPAKIDTVPAGDAPTRFELIGAVRHMPAKGSTEPARFETGIDKVAYLIEGHQVAGHGLCPASVYIEMASAAAQLVFEHHGRMDGDSAIALSDITFSNPLVYSADVKRTICMDVTLTGPGDKHTAGFAVSSYTTDPTKLQPHCAGKLTLASKTLTHTRFGLSATTVAHRHRAVLASRHAETLSTRTIYDLVFARIVAYGAAYHTLQSLTLDPNGVDACAVVQLPAGSAHGAFVAHPVFTDTLLHAVGFVVNCNAGLNEAFICSHVDKVKVLPGIAAGARYGLYCNIGFLSDAVAVGDAYAFELGTEPVNVVAVMKRMQFKKLRMSGFKAILASAASQSGAPVAPRIQTAPERHSQPAPQAQATSPQTSTTVVQQVKEVVASSLGVAVKDITDDSDLERLGLDSLTSIEAHHALCTTLGVDLPEKLFSTCKTVSDIVAAIGPSVASPTAPASPVVPPSRESESTLNDNAVINVGRAASFVKVQEILASVLGVSAKDLRDDQDLERLGMDSLMSIEAHHELSTALGTDLPQDLFTICKTIREIQDAIAPPSTAADSAFVDKVLSSSSSFGTDVNPVLLQEGHGSSDPPLFLIHDGSGIAHQYSRLSSLGRRVWGIHNPKFPEGGKWEGGLFEMAEHYVALIKLKLDGASECLLGGWSIGGVIAFEVARRLIASGIDVPGLVLIDSPHPETTTPLSKAILNAAFSTRSNPSRAVDLARSCIEHATAALVEYDPSSSPAKHVSLKKAVMLRSREPFLVSGPEPNSPSDAFLAHRRDPATIVAGWESILGLRVPVLDIPGNHFEPFDPRYVGEVSERLVEALRLLS